MREYGQVQSAFWQSPDAQSWTDTGKLLALYLLTGPHANGIGCYRLPDGYVMADLGWSSERVTEGFEELFRKGFANRFEGVVFLPNFLRWNAIANGNIAKARFKEFDALPKGQSKALAARAMLEFCDFWETAERKGLETVRQTLSKPIPNQNPTQPNPEITQPREEEREKPDDLPGIPATPKPPGAVKLDTWLDSLPDPDQAIPPDDPIFRYASDTGIPIEFLELSWVRFCEDMRDRGKRQRDWRAHYRNAVRNNWFKLWWFDGSDGGTCKLTTAGEQARRALDGGRRAA